MGEREIESRERNGYSYARKFCEFGESEGDRCLRRSLVARPPDPGLLRMCDAEVWNGSVEWGGREKATKVASSGLDGRLCFWDLTGSALETQFAKLSVTAAS